MYQEKILNQIRPNNIDNNMLYYVPRHYTGLSIGITLCNVAAAITYRLFINPNTAGLPEKDVTFGIGNCIAYDFPLPSPGGEIWSGYVGEAGVSYGIRSSVANALVATILGIEVK